MSGIFLLILRLGMALALYTFLGWAILTIWRDIKRQDELLTTSKLPQITIRQQVEGGEEYQTYNVPEITIGRDQTCDVILSESTVSAEHARLTYHHGNWWVEDLHSRNGTYLNQELLTTQAVVTTGDELRLGQVILSIGIGGNEDQHEILGTPD
jgi:pSer/pThr/pTyr-binding forkhead associated (FHA) protein